MAREHFPQPRKSKALFALIALALSAGMCVGCAQNPVQRRNSYFQTGKTYFQQKKYADAAIEFRNAVKIDSHFAPGYYYLGLTEKQRGHWQSAFRAFRKEIEIAPKQTPGEMDLADLYLMANQPAQARHLADDVLTREPKNFSALLIVAQSQLGEKNYPLALKEFSKLKTMQPRNAPIYLAIGLAQLGEGNYAGAESSFRRGIELNPTSPEGYRDLANLYQKTGRLALAEQTFQQGLKNSGHKPAMFFALADFYCRWGHIDHAQATLESLEKTEKPTADLYAQIGDFWVAHNELQPAIDEYQAAYAKTPSLLLRKKFVATYIAMNNADAAQRWNQEILKTNPNDPQGRMFAGAIDQLRGDNRHAIARLEAVLDNDPRSVFGHYYLGMAYMATGQDDQAKSQFFDCLKTDPGFSYAFLRLGQLSLRNRNAHDATQYARDVLQRDPMMVGGYLLASDAAVLSGNMRQAEEALALANHFSPGSPAIIVRQAILDGLQKHYAKAEREYQSVLMQVKDPTPILAGLAQVYVAQNQTQKAIQQVRFYASGPTADPGLFVLLAQLHIIQNNLGAASQDCQQALHLNPKSAQAYFYLGRIAQLQNDDSAAIQNYARAGRLDPNQSLPFLLAGELSQKIKNWANAETYYQSALQASPDIALAKGGLARAMIEQGEDSNVALGLAQQARSLDPNDPTVADDLGWVDLKEGLPQLAVPLFRQAVAKAPQNASFRFHLGMAYSAAGDKSAARLALLDARRLGLGESEAKQADQTLAALSVPRKSP